MAWLLLGEEQLDARATLVDGPSSLPDLAADDDMEQPAIGVVCTFIGFDVHRFQERLGISFEAKTLTSSEQTKMGGRIGTSSHRC